MKLKTLLFISALAAGLQSNAQTWVADSVEMGAPAAVSYPTDVYYSMKNGVVKSDSNFKWHLAFEMLPAVGPSAGIGIWANHVQGKVSVYSMHKQASTNFASFGSSPSDTAGAFSTPLYNTDSSWSMGAFNVMNDPTDLLDYSWGFYDMNTHNVSGDSLYAIKINGVAYKLWLQEYRSNPSDSISYTFRIAKMDGTGDRTVKIYRSKTPDFTEKQFAYYDVINDVVIDREPGLFTWDVQFTRYIEYISMGPGPLVPYPVMGVLSNANVKVAEVKNVDPDTAHRENYMMSSSINIIGSDWKTFTPPAGPWTVDASATYFIKSTNTSEYYQIKFTGFNSSVGRSIFAKRMVGVTSVNDVQNNVSTYAIVPNPAVNDASFVVDVKEQAQARLLVTDITGKVMLSRMVDLKQGMNAFAVSTSTYAAGTYIVTLGNGSWKISDKLIVQH